jgi:Kef-type K+ transport system membrane component KefB
VLFAAALLLLASIGGKLLGAHIAGRVLRWPKGEAAVIGWLLQTKALIMIIFANILLDKGIIASTTFTALLLMAVASTMLSIPMVTPKIARLRGKDHIVAGERSPRPAPTALGEAAVSADHIETVGARNLEATPALGPTDA